MPYYAGVALDGVRMVPTQSWTATARLGSLGWRHTPNTSSADRQLARGGGVVESGTCVQSLHRAPAQFPIIPAMAMALWFIFPMGLCFSNLDLLLVLMR